MSTDHDTIAISSDRLGFALHQARRGRTVIVLLAQARQIRPIMGWIERHSDPSAGERVHWARGLEAFRQVASPGVVEVISPGVIYSGRYHGRHADLVIVGPGVMMTADLEEHLAVMLLDADPMDVDTDPGSLPILREGQ